MKNCFALVSCFYLFISCGSAPVRTTQNGDQLYNDFRERRSLFWEKAKEKDFEKRIELWDRFVEGRYTSLYTSLLWSESEKLSLVSPLFGQLYKRIYLYASFSLYDKHNEEIAQSKIEYQKMIMKQIQQFKGKFPQAKLDGLYVIMPLGFNQNLAYASIFNSTDYVVRPGMVLNSDILALVPTVVESIIYHELFHMYSIEQKGIQNYQKRSEEGEFTLADVMMEEGIATYGASLFGEFNEDPEGMKKVNTINIEVLNKLKEEFAERGLGDKFEAALAKLPETSTFGHCDKYIKKKIEVNFKCRDIYLMGAEMVKGLVLTSSLESIMRLSQDDVEKKVITFLKSRKSSKKAKSILEHI